MSQPALRRYVTLGELVEKDGEYSDEWAEVFKAADIEPLLKCWAKIVMGEAVPSVEEYKEAKRLLAGLTEGA